MNSLPQKDINKILNDTKKVEKTMAKYVRKAIKLHELMKVPYVISRNGKMVTVTPK